MRHALLITLALVALALPVPTLAGPSAGRAEALDQASTLVKQGQYQKAATIIEDALPGAPRSERGALLDLLRSTYRELIRQAETGGKTQLAEEYRDNLAIISPSAAEQKVSPPVSEAPSKPADLEPFSPVAAPAIQREPAVPAPSAPVAAPADDAGVVKAGLRALPRTASPGEPADLGEPSVLPDPGPLPSLDGPARERPQPRPPAQSQRQLPANPVPRTDSLAMPSSDAPTTRAGTSEERKAAPTPAQLTPESAPATTPAILPAPASALAQADRLFTSKKYEDAGRIYARLAALNQLPTQRKQVWAYCRWVGVVAKINGPPKSDREWNEIEQEIRSVQRLVPGNWYGEYLQNRAAEARRAAGRSGKLVVRGSAPEENSPRKFPRLLGRSHPRSTPPAQLADATPAGEQALGLPNADLHEETPRPAGGNRNAAANPQSMAAPVPVAPTETPAARPLSWHVHESANFRVYHVDAAMALEASKAAEAVRASQAKRWRSLATRSTWTPKCDIYLYPTPRDFAQMTGQPETSPGFSTMGVNGNRIIARRVNLRADHPQILTAILPHEVTHVVLADLFTEKQIPRWADEGMAVLAEPVSEQHSRAVDLAAPFEQNRLFRLSELMAIDYPNAESWALYYAQSVSLTQFLVEQASPEQFVSFVRSAQRHGIEHALREVYQIEGFPDLESRWQTYARHQITTLTAAKEEPAAAADVTRRE